VSNGKTWSISFRIRIEKRKPLIARIRGDENGSPVNCGERPHLLSARFVERAKQAGDLAC
jgi:hypothetical protein